MIRHTRIALLLLGAAALWAQVPNGPQGLTEQPNQTDNILNSETRQVYMAISGNLIKAAQQMPENLYSFRPTGTTRSFGDLLGHIARVQNDLCLNLNGKSPWSLKGEATKTGRIADLQASIVECGIAFSELSAENANKMVQAPAGRITHLAALDYIITHASEEYGQLGMYLRLNHMMPPTSDEASGGGAGHVSAR